MFVQSVALLLRAGNIPPPYRRNGSRSAIEDLEWFKSVGTNKACEEKKAERGACSKSEALEAQISPQQARGASKKIKPTTRVGFYFLVAEMGFEPHDLRVMSPASYQTAPLRDILVPEAGVEPVREKISRDFKSRASANSATPAYAP